MDTDFTEMRGMLHFSESAKVLRFGSEVLIDLFARRVYAGRVHRFFQVPMAEHGKPLAQGAGGFSTGCQLTPWLRLAA